MKKPTKNLSSKDGSVMVRPEWERISQSYAAVLLNIDSKQLLEWEKAEDSILELLKGSRQVTRVEIPKWPEMEAQLHIHFKDVRM